MDQPTTTDDPLRVMLVDDEPAVLLTLAANLELEGYRVLQASSAERALELARTERFDLVLTDVVMPGMHGIDLYRQIRRLHGDVPVIVMTAFALEQLVSEGIEEGVYSVVYKPFPMNVVLNLVERAARRGAIMVVDDVSAVTSSLAGSLDTVGMTVIEAMTGQEALDVLDKNDPVDVCVVDLVMPEMSGAELCGHVVERDPRIGLVAMTGHDAPELIAEAFRNGSHVCLRKPFELGTLLKAIAGVRRKLAERSAAADLR